MKEDNQTDINIIRNNHNKNKSFKQIKVDHIKAPKTYSNYINIKNKSIELSKIKNFPDLMRIKKSMNNLNIENSSKNCLYVKKNKINSSKNEIFQKINIMKAKSRNPRLSSNSTDFNTYMGNVINIQIPRITNKMTLNQYLKTESSNKENLISNTNSLTHDKSYINEESIEDIKPTFNNLKKYSKKYNSFIIKKDKCTSLKDMNTLYFRNGTNLNNNKNNTLNNLRKILQELKAKNNEIKTELNLIQKQNLENLKFEQNEKNQNQNLKLYNIIKDILNGKNNNNSLHPFNTNLYTTLTMTEKINFLDNIYREEKLKDSLIEKTNLLYLKYNKKNLSAFDLSEEGDAHRIAGWLGRLVESIDNLKKNNEKIKKSIHNLTKEKKAFKHFYNNLMNKLGTKNKDELFKKIDDMVNYKNINDNEEAKMFKILLNKK